MPTKKQKNVPKRFKEVAGLLIAVLFLLVSVFVIQVNADGKQVPIMGYAWSTVSGWFSSGCDSGGDCSKVQYGLTLDTQTGILSGKMWVNPKDLRGDTDNIGYISFDKNVKKYSEKFPKNNYPRKPGGGPGGAVAWVDFNTGFVHGWARSCSVFKNGCSGDLRSNTERGGWDGWIALRGANFGVEVDVKTGDFSGFAWGAANHGWISFQGLNHKVTAGPLTLDDLYLKASPTNVNKSQGFLTTLTWNTTRSNFTRCEASSTPQVADWNNSTVIQPVRVDGTDSFSLRDIFVEHETVRFDLRCIDENNPDAEWIEARATVKRSDLFLHKGEECIDPDRGYATIVYGTEGVDFVECQPYSRQGDGRNKITGWIHSSDVTPPSSLSSTGTTLFKSVRIYNGYLPATFGLRCKDKSGRWHPENGYIADVVRYSDYCEEEPPQNDPATVSFSVTPTCVDVASGNLDLRLLWNHGRNTETRFNRCRSTYSSPTGKIIPDWRNQRPVSCVPTDRTPLCTQNLTIDPAVLPATIGIECAFNRDTEIVRDSHVLYDCNDPNYPGVSNPDNAIVDLFADPEVLDKPDVVDLSWIVDDIDVGSCTMQASTAGTPFSVAFSGEEPTKLSANRVQIGGFDDVAVLQSMNFYMECQSKDKGGASDIGVASVCVATDSSSGCDLCQIDPTFCQVYADDDDVQRIRTIRPTIIEE